RPGCGGDRLRVAVDGGVRPGPGRGPRPRLPAGGAGGDRPAVAGRRRGTARSGPATRACVFLDGTARAGGAFAAGIWQEVVVMARVKSVAEWMAERGLDLAGLVEASGLDRRVVEAIAHGRYTPSPEQRRLLAAALGVGPEQVAWGHVAQVEH